MQDEVASTRCSCFSFGSRRGAKTCDNESVSQAAQPRRHDAEQPTTREKERKGSMSAAPQNQVQVSKTGATIGVRGALAYSCRPIESFEPVGQASFNEYSKKDDFYYDMEFVVEDQPCVSDDNATVTAWNSATNVSHKRELLHLGLLELNSNMPTTPL